MKILNSKFKIRNCQKGFSLYLAIMIMVVLLALALGISAVLYSQMKMMRGMENSVIAFYAADTGIEKVLYAISNNDFRQNYSGSIGEASYYATLVCGANYDNCPPSLATSSDCLADYYCLKSIGTYKEGTYNETKRAIEVTH